MLDHSIPTMVVTIQLLHCNKTNLKFQYGMCANVLHVSHFDFFC
jgi:hypothetical protein